MSLQQLSRQIHKLNQQKKLTNSDTFHEYLELFKKLSEDDGQIYFDLIANPFYKVNIIWAIRSYLPPELQEESLRFLLDEVNSIEDIDDKLNYLEDIQDLMLDNDFYGTLIKQALQGLTFTQKLEHLKKLRSSSWILYCYSPLIKNLKERSKLIFEIDDGYLRDEALEEFAAEITYPMLRKDLISMIKDINIQSRAMWQFLTSDIFVNDTQERLKYINTIPSEEIRSGAMYEESLKMNNLEQRQHYVNTIPYKRYRDQGLDALKNKIKLTQAKNELILNSYYTNNLSQQQFLNKLQTIRKIDIVHFLKKRAPIDDKLDNIQTKQELLKILNKSKRDYIQSLKREKSENASQDKVLDIIQGDYVSINTFLKQTDHIIIHYNSKIYGFSLEFGDIFYQCVDHLKWQKYLQYYTQKQNEHGALFKLRGEIEVCFRVYDLLTLLKQGYNVFYVTENKQNIKIISKKALGPPLNFVSSAHCQPNDITKISTITKYENQFDGLQMTAKVKRMFGI